MLYGRCYRIARKAGYDGIITYTKVSETGVSLKASNFKILRYTKPRAAGNAGHGWNSDGIFKICWILA